VRRDYCELEIPERIPVLFAQGRNRSDHGDLREPAFIRRRMIILSDRGEMKVLSPFRVERRMVAITADLKTKGLALGMGQCAARLS